MTRSKAVLPLLPLTALAPFVGSAIGQQEYFDHWPRGASPHDEGEALAEHFVLSPHQYTATIHYTEVGTWYGAVTFAQ